MSEVELKLGEARVYSTEHDFRERNEQLRHLALLEGTLQTSLPSSNNELKDLRLSLAYNKNLDQRPSRQTIEDFALSLKKMPHHQEGEHFTGTYESVMTEVIRVAADDIDRGLELPDCFKGPSASGWLFENYRGWTVGDFDFLFKLLDEKVFLPGTLEQIRYQAIQRQDKLEYDQERDLSAIFDISSPLKLRGFALERVLKKLEKDPAHLNVIISEGEEWKKNIVRNMPNDEYRNYVDSTIRFIENKIGVTPELVDEQDKVMHPFE
jgi:hypothetical protein